VGQEAHPRFWSNLNPPSPDQMGVWCEAIDHINRSTWRQALPVDQCKGWEGRPTADLWNGRRSAQISQYFDMDCWDCTEEVYCWSGNY